MEAGLLFIKINVASKVHSIDMVRRLTIYVGAF